MSPGEKNVRPLFQAFGEPDPIIFGIKVIWRSLKGHFKVI